MSKQINFSYELLQQLEFRLPESALNKVIDDGDYNINHLLDSDGYRELVEATERLMHSAEDHDIDLARVEGFAQVKDAFTHGDDGRVDAAEAMAYLVGCAYATNTEYKDGKVVSAPNAAIRPETLTTEEKRLAVEIACQVLGDTFPKYSVSDTTTEESMKGVVNAARAVQNKRNEKLAKEQAKRDRDNSWVE